MREQRFRTLDEFWPTYVREHSSPRTRRLHFIATTNLLVWLFFAALRRKLRPVILGVVTSCAIAWFGHVVIERNRPDTFAYPVLSVLADLRMYVAIWRGEMAAEAEKYVTVSDPAVERHIIV